MILYKNYAEQSALVKNEMPQLLTAPNFTNSYLSAIKANNYVTDSRSPGDVSLRRQLNTAAGAYTLLRHELAAYAKQSYTNIGRGLVEKEKTGRKSVPQTFVENAPMVFSQLKKSVVMLSTLAGNPILTERGQKLADVLQILADTAGEKPLPASKSERI